MTSMFKDHKGKYSQGRVTAFMSALVGCTLCLAMLWGHPSPDISVLLILFGGPSGLALYQKERVEKKT